jgi:GT2 family glycosyltransferase
VRAIVGDYREAVAELFASVVVPVRNGRHHLDLLLAALEKQTIPRDRFEVLIGDDGSNDGSTDDLETSDGWIRVFKGPPRSSYAARNRAAKAARAPVLAFCDADCQPEPEWLEAGVAAMEHGEAETVAAGRIRFDVPERPTVWTLIDIDTTKDHRREVEIGNAETANLVVRREFFERIGGFDDTIPEHGDFDFALRAVDAGARLVYSPDVVVWHPTRNTARPFLRMVWVMHRWYAAREVRAGRRPLGLRLRWWIPVLHARWRHRSGRSLGLDRWWLGQNGVTPRLRDNLRAVPIIYLLMPAIAGVAQLRGWADGRRLRATMNSSDPAG